MRQTRVYSQFLCTISTWEWSITVFGYSHSAMKIIRLLHVPFVIIALQSSATVIQLVTGAPSAHRPILESCEEEEEDDQHDYWHLIPAWQQQWRHHYWSLKTTATATITATWYIGTSASCVSPAVALRLKNCGNYIFIYVPALKANSGFEISRSIQTIAKAGNSAIMMQ